jgi:hypothetical protein
VEFYTEMLGFVKKNDVAAGEYRWLTVVSPDDQNGTELLLEQNDNPVAQAYQRGIFEQGSLLRPLVLRTSVQNMKS